MGNSLVPVLLLIVGLFVGAIIAFAIMALKKKNEETDIFCYSMYKIFKKII